MRARAFPLFALALHALTPHEALATACADDKAIIIGAGDSGTRAYLYSRPGLWRGAGSRVTSVELGRESVALSSFESSPAQAQDVIARYFAAAKDHLAANDRQCLRVAVLATASMRRLPNASQLAIHNALRDGLNQSAQNDFNASRLDVRTLTNHEESSYKLAALNYGFNRIDAHVVKAPPLPGYKFSQKLFGFKELGDHSTQVAAPPGVTYNDEEQNLAQRLRNRTKTWTRSYPDFGMERIRRLTYARIVNVGWEASRAQRAVSNPCAFYGHSEEAAEWRGTGEASYCESFITKVVMDEQEKCMEHYDHIADAKQADAQREENCMGFPAMPYAEKFFLVSGYADVTDFARWWLRRSGFSQDARPLAYPTANELREAADVLCAAAWSELSAAAVDAEPAASTPAHRVPHRCFDLCYIVVLLTHGLRYKEDVAFDIPSRADVREIDWVQGAFLLMPFA